MYLLLYENTKIYNIDGFLDGMIISLSDYIAYGNKFQQIRIILLLYIRESLIWLILISNNYIESTPYFLIPYAILQIYKYAFRSLTN